jgi:hypothetical protein
MSSARSVRVRASVLVACAALCVAVFLPDGRARRIETVALGASPVSVSRGAGLPPGAYVANATLFVPGAHPARLAAVPSAPLTGWLSPAVVPSADRRFAVYSAWRAARADDPARSWSAQGIEIGDALGTPEIRSVDLATGADTLVASGAHSPALSGSGRLAYVAGATRTFAAGAPYYGTIVVRDGVDGAPASWTTVPRRYAIAAWAGERLLAYEMGEGEALSLVAFDGPNRWRSMGEGTLVAVSQDGTLAFTEQTDSAPPRVSVVRVSDGAVVAALRLDRGAPAALGIDSLSYSGAWTGDTVVARACNGLAIFTARAGSIAAVDLLRFDPVAFPGGLVEPRFARPGEIVAWAERVEPSGARHAAVLDCRIAARACASFPMPRGSSPAFNPSAPL